MYSVHCGGLINIPFSFSDSKQHVLRINVSKWWMRWLWVSEWSRCMPGSTPSVMSWIQSESKYTLSTKCAKFCAYEKATHLYCTQLLCLGGQSCQRHSEGIQLLCRGAEPRHTVVVLCVCVCVRPSVRSIFYKTAQNQLLKTATLA